MEEVLQTWSHSPQVRMNLRLETSAALEEEEALGWRDFEHGLVVVWCWYWRIFQRLAKEAVPQILEGVVLSVEMAL